MFIFRIETPQGHGLYRCRAMEYIRANYTDNPSPSIEPELGWECIANFSDYYFGFGSLSQAARWFGGYSHLGDALQESDAIMAVYECSNEHARVSESQAIFIKKNAKLISRHTSLKRLSKLFGHISPEWLLPR